MRTAGMRLCTDDEKENKCKGARKFKSEKRMMSNNFMFELDNSSTWIKILADLVICERPVAKN
jgi:hypothetical protein